MFEKQTLSIGISMRLVVYVEVIIKYNLDNLVHNKYKQGIYIYILYSYAHKYNTRNRYR